MEIPLDMTKRYTYADYLTWMDDVRRELIDGIVSLMAGTSINHGKVGTNLVWCFQSIVKSNKCNCEVLYAPIDVCLPKNGETENNKIYTVVQPDVFVVCDLTKLEDGRCFGAPDMIIEILSKSTRRKDLHDKFLLYEKAGVREYWIANPKSKNITAYIMQDNDEYDDGTEYILGEKIPVHIFDGYLIEVNEIFNF